MLCKSRTWRRNERIKINRLALDTLSLQDVLFSLTSDELLIRGYVVEEILLRAVSGQHLKIDAVSGRCWLFFLHSAVLLFRFEALALGTSDWHFVSRMFSITPLNNRLSDRTRLIECSRHIFHIHS